MWDSPWRGNPSLLFLTTATVPIDMHLCKVHGSPADECACVWWCFWCLGLAGGLEGSPVTWDFVCFDLSGLPGRQNHLYICMQPLRKTHTQINIFITNHSCIDLSVSLPLFQVHFAKKLTLKLTFGLCNYDKYIFSNYFVHLCLCMHQLLFCQ